MKKPVPRDSKGRPQFPKLGMKRTRWLEKQPVELEGVVSNSKDHHSWSWESRYTTKSKMIGDVASGIAAQLQRRYTED